MRAVTFHTLALVALTAAFGLLASGCDDDAEPVGGTPVGDVAVGDSGGILDATDLDAPADVSDLDATADDTTADTTEPDGDTGAADAADDASDADAGPAPVVCEPSSDEAPRTLRVGPYLQSATPESMWVLWETETGEHTEVRYGLTEALGLVACGGTVTSGMDNLIHEVQLTGLTADTVYYYQSATDDAVSAIHHFRTPPAPDSEAPTRLVAFGDGQRDSKYPDRYREVVQDGAIAWLKGEGGEDLADAVDMALYAGDLVDSGWDYWSWEYEFFTPSAELLSQVPMYPAAGNHEANSVFYWAYFHLPENGTEGFQEHWFWVDHSNLRVLGLDTNDGYRTDKQLQWLDDVLEATCQDDHIDFVLAEMHHPHKSELWIPGELDYSGELVARLEAFSTACGKPTVHFFGHTHAYSRGASRDHRHMMVNVSSAGGGLDRWGEQEQTDYPEFSVSTDDYGFVVMDVTAGDDPSVRLRRLSRGRPEASLDNVLTDDVTLRLHNAAPATPEAVAGVSETLCAGEVVLVASAFSDPDGDTQAAAHWQVAETCDDFSAPVHDGWRQHQNWYMGADTQAGDDLTDEALPALEAGSWCWRVRYRDPNLSWSAWSEPAEFTVGVCDAFQ